MHRQTLRRLVSHDSHIHILTYTFTPLCNVLLPLQVVLVGFLVQVVERLPAKCKALSSIPATLPPKENSHIKTQRKTNWVASETHRQLLLDPRVDPRSLSLKKTHSVNKLDDLWKWIWGGEVLGIKLRAH